MSAGRDGAVVLATPNRPAFERLLGHQASLRVLRFSPDGRILASLPLAVGEATAAEVADVLERVWGGDETLIVISSDLSHFLPDAAARKRDGGTVDAILALDSHLSHEQACGATPVNGLLLAAKRHGLRAVKLDVCNSSDTAGDPDRVVGYAAFAFEPEVHHEHA